MVRLLLVLCLPCVVRAQEIVVSPIVMVPVTGSAVTNPPDSMAIGVDSLKWYINVNWLTASNNDSIGTVPDTTTGQIDLIAPTGTGRRFVYKTSTFGSYPAIVSGYSTKQSMSCDSIVKHIRGDDIPYTLFYGGAIDSTTIVDWHFMLGEGGDDLLRLCWYGDRTLGNERTIAYSRNGQNSDYETYTDSLFGGNVLAWVYAADSVRLYRNGTLVDGPDYIPSAAIAPSQITIGSYRMTDALYQTALKVSFMALYRKALSAGDVLTITNRVKKYVGR